LRVVVPIAVLVVALLSVPLATTRGGASPVPPRAGVSVAASPLGKHIKHIVVIYQENHSFDETLGAFCTEHHNRCDGYVGDVVLSDGVVAPMKKSPAIVPQVWHDVTNQAIAINLGRMNGWNNVMGCNPPRFPRACLTYYTPEQIPNLTGLAAKYVVSDRTFSMYDSPSWGGHLYPAAATQDNFTGDLPISVPGVSTKRGWGCASKKLATWTDPETHAVSRQPSCVPARPGSLDAVKYPYGGAFQATAVDWVPTIFDRLDGKHLSWRLYSSVVEWAICPSFAECLFGPQHTNVVKTTQILTDAQRGELPAYSVVLPEGPGGATDQHNGSSMRAGDNWIGRVLATLQKSPQWSSTAVFITYDDCGCFYDHVAPGVNADGSPQGIRVPMVIVSPWTKRGYTDHHQASFASILKFTELAFGLRNLGVNDGEAYDYADSFDFNARPSGSRVVLRQHPLSAAEKAYLAAHPPNLNDPT